MIQELISFASNFVSGYEKGKIQLFNQHVEPLKNQIFEIHSDYINSFLEVRGSLSKKEVPISEMLEFLEQRRHALAAQRDLTKSIASSLQNADRRIVTPHAWNAFENFSNSVLNYFNSVNSIANVSWYSDFINFMKVSRMAEIEATFFDTNVFGNDPRMDTIRHINILVERELPAALNEVNKYYAELRTALL